MTELILDATSDAVVVLDEDLRIVSTSRAFCDLFGVTEDDVVGRSVYSVCAGSLDERALHALLERHLEASSSVDEYVIGCHSTAHDERVFAASARRNEDYSRIVLALRDVTWERAERAVLEASAEQLRLFIQTAREYAIFLTNAEGHITVWNPGAERILGWSNEEAIGMSAEVIFTPSDRAAGVPAREMEQARTTGEALDERWHLRKDGTRFWASGILVALEGGGSFRGFAKILRDNTRRKVAQTRIEASRRWLRRIVEVTPDVLALYDLDEERMTFVSPALFYQLGRARGGRHGAVARQSPTHFLHPDDRARAAAIRDEIKQSGLSEPYETSVRALDAAGRMRWFHVRVVPFERDEEGRLREVLVVARDFTEMRETQAQLRALTESLEERVVRRTEQVRTLASMLTSAEEQERRRISQILHDDLQQRLYGIQIKLASLRRAIGDERSEHLAGEVDLWIRGAIDVTRKLTVDLSPPVLKGADFRYSLDWLVVQMQEMYGLDVSVDAPASCVIEDEDVRILLFQIARELLFNVVKHAGVDRARVLLERRGADLVLRVVDGGAGFDPEATAAHPHAEATFGLFSVQERLHLFGGRIEITSRPGGGTAIEIEVPLSLD